MSLSFILVCLPLTQAQSLPSTHREESSLICKHSIVPVSFQGQIYRGKQSLLVYLMILFPLLLPSFKYYGFLFPLGYYNQLLNRSSTSKQDFFLDPSLICVCMCVFIVLYFVKLLKVTKANPYFFISYLL